MNKMKTVVILLVAVLCLTVMVSCQKRVGVELPTTVAVADAIGQEVYFDFDKFNLSAQAQKVLDMKVGYMAENPQYTVTIGGHCDERGTAEYNMALGERRANAAKKYMVSKGVAANRVVTISYGENDPADAAHNEAAWAKNRRDTFVFQY